MTETVEELWAASVEKDRERRRRENRWEWVRHFDALAASHAGMAREFEERAAALLEDEGGGG